jgi:DNA-binding LacI/PurR family transcriptional regulator
MDPAAAELAIRPGHAVFIDPAGPRPRVPESSAFVRTDDPEGILELVRHLRDTGRSRFAYVAGPPIASDRIRRDAIRAAIETMGLDPDVRVLAPAQTWEDHLGIVEEVARERPDALVCYDDRAALTIMSALRERGLRVPQDIAVTGFDDIPFARLANPRLTTVAQPVEAMGATAAAMLVDAIETGERSPSVTFPVELVVRESTAPVSPLAATAVAVSGDA